MSRLGTGISCDERNRSREMLRVRIANCRNGLRPAEITLACPVQWRMQTEKSCRLLIGMGECTGLRIFIQAAEKG